MSTSPLKTRLYRKLVGRGINLPFDQMRHVQGAFVEALKEEVEYRFEPNTHPSDPNAWVPVRIAGLGSFRMKTRGERRFLKPGGKKWVDAPVAKPPARRLVFTAKWEPLP